MKSSSAPQSFIDIDANSSLVFSIFDIVFHISYLVSLLFYLLILNLVFASFLWDVKKIVLQSLTVVERKAYLAAQRASRFVGEPVGNTATDTNKNAEPAVTQLRFREAL